MLKDYDLSYEEIESGLVGGGGDGGIDGIYAFANGQLIGDDSETDGLVRNVRVELFIIQSKLETGFSELVTDRFPATTMELLGPSKSLENVEGGYNCV